MDGNGRWAKQKALIRTNGHQKGAKNLENIVEFCVGANIKTLTLYAFSTENWKRPQNEVSFLMKLLKKFLVEKRDLFIKNEIAFHTIGDISKFDEDIRNEIKTLKNISSKNTKMNLVLALNYGSKDEIIRAVKKTLEDKKEINEENISSNLDTASFGDVDLLIRTGGEQRLSNFLLWQAAYAEFAFTKTLWPDFTPEELAKIIENYTHIHRKFGGL